MNAAPAPSEPWQPLPPADWDSAAARHLLLRAGWSARPDEIERARRDGLAATIDRLFPASLSAFSPPAILAELQHAAAGVRERRARLSAAERRNLARERREEQRRALRAFGIAWLQHAAKPANAAVEKWVSFLADVYVVSSNKVTDANLIAGHWDLLRRHAFDPAPALTKAVSRSPAMIRYLDLQQSRRDAPNENFARELFELFLLGEGHYAETDIKAAAHAFTGYRERDGAFVFASRQHDSRPITIFGRTGRFSGDAVIDLAYAQPAAATFLPRELARFYLTAESLPDPLLAELGSAWRDTGFDLRWLARTFFSSRTFFAPEFRANFIRSPVQFYLGLLHDLQLDVTPVPRFSLQPLRQTGQTLFTPPNVRGWVGGRNWINSSTLAGRRLLVQRLLSPFDESLLNADDQRELVRARDAGAASFTLDRLRFATWAKLGPDALAADFHRRFVPAAAADTVSRLQTFLVGSGSGVSPARVRDVLAALLQSPDYQLC